MASSGLFTVVEFFGAPAVGKTSLAKDLADHFRSQGITASDHFVLVGKMSRMRRIIYKIKSIFPILVTMPGLLVVVVEFIFKSGAKKPATVIRLLINWLFIIAQIHHEKQKYNTVILDQGIVQALWSTAFRGYSIKPDIVVKLTERILSECGIGNLIVVNLTVGHKIHRKRLASRLKPGTSLKERDFSQLNNGRHVAEYVAEIFRQAQDKISGSVLCSLIYFKGSGQSDACLLFQKMKNHVSNDGV